jgi:hypothetical protein
MRVLGERECVITAEPQKLIGNRLIARVSSAVRPGAGVRIDCPDSFVLGEVLGCWRDGAIFTAIELLHQVTGLGPLPDLELPLAS